MCYVPSQPSINCAYGDCVFQGNFFQNIGSILVFAVFGTAISAMVVGGGVYLLGQVCVLLFIAFLIFI